MLGSAKIVVLTDMVLTVAVLNVAVLNVAVGLPNVARIIGRRHEMKCRQSFSFKNTRRAKHSSRRNT